MKRVLLFALMAVGIIASVHYFGFWVTVGLCLLLFIAAGVCGIV